MSRGTVISLCDLTGIFVRPWVEAGYRAVLVDPQHGHTSGGRVTRLAMTVEKALPRLADIIAHEDVHFVAGFPPCTDLAVSGAKHFQRKMTDPSWEHYRGPNMWYDALRVVWQCEMVGQLSGAPWFVENPVGRLSTLWRKPDHSFHPCDFTDWASEDNYTKKTCLWTGGGFIMPNPSRDESLGTPDDRIHKAPPGDDRANFRSATPLGFARAVFHANSGYAQGAVA